jgi:hypothetical protein
MADFSMNYPSAPAQSTLVSRGSSPGDAEYKAPVQAPVSDMKIPNHILKMHTKHQEALRYRMIRILRSNIAELEEIMPRCLFANTPAPADPSEFNGDKPDVRDWILCLDLFFEATRGYCLKIKYSVNLFK